MSCTFSTTTGCGRRPTSDKHTTWAKPVEGRPIAARLLGDPFTAAAIPPALQNLVGQESLRNWDLPSQRRSTSAATAVCHVATVLLTRIAACLRTGQPYIIRDLDRTEVTKAEGRRIVTAQHQVDPKIRATNAFPSSRRAS